jgi:hypothetical protein
MRRQFLPPHKSTDQAGTGNVTISHISKVWGGGRREKMIIVAAFIVFT